MSTFWTTRRLVLWQLFWLSIVLLGLFAASGTAQQQAGSAAVSYPPLLIRDEGVDQGRLTKALNFTGSGVSCSFAAGVGTCNVTSGGGSFSVTETEIDFDTCGIGAPASTAWDTCVVTVTDAAVTTSSKVVAWQAGVAPTSREVDDNEMDPLICFVNPGTGDFSLTCRVTDDSSTHGKFKIYYAVG